jgi:hypothetical protein
MNAINLANGADFSGTWSGFCKSGNDKNPSEIVITNDLNSISYDGDLYSLTAPNVNKVSGKDNSQAYQMVMIYDWQWNENKSVILMSEKWLGWFVNQHGTWSQKILGSIKLDGNQLVTNRTAEAENVLMSTKRTEENCIYNRK